MVMNFFISLPFVTNLFLITSTTINCLCFIDFIKPIDIFLNYCLVINFFNYWRLVTHIFYFGQIGLKTIFYVFFFIRYSKTLENIAFQNKQKNYFYMLCAGNSIMLLLKIFVPNANFLGSSMVFMVIYMWSKKNAYQVINLMDILCIKGSNLPLFLIISGYCTKQTTLKLDIMGMIAGHLCYYLQEIYPRITGGQRAASFL